MLALPLLWSLFLAGSPPAAAATACDNWGQVSPSDKIVYTGETATFYILGASDGSCGNADACAWSVDNGLGTLSATTGGSVDWTAPDTLDNCLAVDLRIYVECPGVNPGSSTISLRCTDEDLATLRSQGSTVAGGGCGDPASSASVLLLLPFLRRRRRS